MAKIVDEQNKDAPNYKKMSDDYIKLKNEQSVSSCTSTILKLLYMNQVW